GSSTSGYLAARGRHLGERPRHGLAIETQLADHGTADLDHRDPLEHGGVQRLVGLDVDLAELEPRQVRCEGEQLRAGLSAVLAAVAAVEHHRRSRVHAWTSQAR